MKFDPKNRGEFEAFAIEAWKQKVTNLRRVVDVWQQYLEWAEGVSHDISKDPASRLIIALLATQTGIGIHDISTPQQATEEIRRVRN